MTTNQATEDYRTVTISQSWWDTLYTEGTVDQINDLVGPDNIEVRSRNNWLGLALHINELNPRFDFDLPSGTVDLKDEESARALLAQLLERFTDPGTPDGGGSNPS